MGRIPAASTSACLPALTPAPFPASTDTTEPGTLLGPFDGRVVDAQSSRPVPGALVWVAWRFCKGTSVCLPAGTETASVETDADGRYVVPRLAHFPGAVRLDGVTLIVYKRGYTGYRSDRVFDDHVTGSALPRRDFAQAKNDVRLDRYPEGGSHSMHLAFLGGSGALRSALRAEALQASLDGAAAPVAQLPLDATSLLTVEELKQITGGVDETTVERLEDRPRTPRYDSAHFRATGRGEEFDAAFRVVLGDTAADTERTYEDLLAELPGAQSIDPVPPGLGLRAARGRAGDGDVGIIGLLILDRVQRTTLLFTCGTALCRNPEMIDAIARKVVARLPRIAHPAPDADSKRSSGKPDAKPAPKPNPEEEPMKLREPGLRR